LFVVAALIVTAVLAVVLALGWNTFLRNEIERLDDRLCQEARRMATQPRLGDEPALLDADLRLRLRAGTDDAMMWRLQRGPAEASAQSATWGAGFDADAQAWQRVERLGPPPPLPPGPGREPPDEDSPPPQRAEYGGPPPRPLRREGPPPPRGNCELTGYTVQGIDWRAARFTTPRARAVLALSLSAVKAEMQSDVQRALKVVVPLALALTAAGAWLLASLTMRPVNRLRLAMHGLTLRALDQRVPTKGEDREFKELIEAYNTMLARLETSFQQASRFSADAAHELKTPLTILQGRLEQAIQQSDRRAIQMDLSEMLDEVSRLGAITRKLLLLSQADAGQLALHRERVDLAGLLDALVVDAQMLVTDQPVSSAVEPGLSVRGDALLLRQLCNNLLSNALRYCRPGGWITVSASEGDGAVEVVFANATAPISSAERQRFFDRFHRGDSAHNRAVDGHGLGLSLSREIARAHGGDLTLEPGADDEVRLLLRLPRD
jgi:signal transduction histidine kinase